MPKKKTPVKTSKPRAKKPTMVQKEDRVVEVQKLLLKRYTRPEIIEHCSKIWGIKRAASDNLIQEASKQIEDDLASIRKTQLAVFIQTLRDLYNQALKEGNLQVARQIIMDSAKLMGLDKTTINHIVEDNRELETLSDHELESIISQASERADH